MSSDKQGLGSGVELGSLSCGLICWAQGGGPVWCIGFASGHQGMEGQGHNPRSTCMSAHLAHIPTARFSGARQVLWGFW